MGLSSAPGGEGAKYMLWIARLIVLHVREATTRDRRGAREFEFDFSEKIHEDPGRIIGDLTYLEPIPQTIQIQI